MSASVLPGRGANNLMIGLRVFVYPLIASMVAQEASRLLPSTFSTERTLNVSARLVILRPGTAT